MNNCITQQTVNDTSMEEYLKQKAKLEDQVDYAFIQRIIQELTQSCALPLPVPASAIPPLILQAFEYFTENYDMASEERWFCIPANAVQKLGANNVIKLPPQINAVCGVYPTSGNFNYGVMGDFSLERMILNNSAMTSGVGGRLNDVFGSGTGYGLQDVTAALYEVSTFKAVFESPLTYTYNPYSNELVILGALRYSDLILDVFKRCKLQDLYKLHYFFRYCVCLGMRSMSTIMGTFSFKMPGGVEINYSQFAERANEEMQQIEEWINKQHTPDYFFNSNTI